MMSDKDKADNDDKYNDFDDGNDGNKDGNDSDYKDSKLLNDDDRLLITILIPAITMSYSGITRCIPDTFIPLQDLPLKPR